MLVCLLVYQICINCSVKLLICLLRVWQIDLQMRVIRNTKGILINVVIFGVIAAWAVRPECTTFRAHREYHKFIHPFIHSFIHSLVLRSCVTANIFTSPLG